jgi:hypothetical protein
MEVSMTTRRVMIFRSNTSDPEGHFVLASMFDLSVVGLTS